MIKADQILRYCPQCGREVDPEQFNSRESRCSACWSANVQLYRYWRSIGMPLSRDSKAHRVWLPWEIERD
jgi:predicted amidophosphoribosyltransferase